MATLEKIRKRAGLLVVVIGVALFAFVIGDFLNSGSTYFRQQHNKIAVVDGEVINIQDYQAREQEMSEIYKLQSGSSSLTEEMTSQMRENLFEGMVTRILLDKASAQTGFAVGKDELADLLMGNQISPIIQNQPMFRNPQTNAFDRAILLNFLKTVESDDFYQQPEQVRAQLEPAKKYWRFLERIVLEQRMQEKYANLLSKAVVMNTLDAQDEFEAGKSRVDFDYAVKNYLTVPDDQVSVPDREIQQLYNLRKENFKQEEARFVSYISVNITPSDEDYTEVENLLFKLKDEFATTHDVVGLVNDQSDVPYSHAFVSLATMTPSMKQFVENAKIGDIEGPVLTGNIYNMYRLMDETVAPDSIHLVQLSFPAMEEAVMNHLADSLIAVVKGGKQFEEVISELTGGQTNGDMNWLTETELLRHFDERFKNEVFDAPANKVFLAKSTTGNHLVQIIEKTKPVKKYKVADLQIQVNPSTPTYNNLYNKLTQYVVAHNTVDSFKVAAAREGFVCNTEVRITKNDPSLSMIKNSRQIIRWAFENKLGAISEIYDCNNQVLVVAAIENEVKTGYRPLAEVSEILKRELLNEKKAEMIIADLKSKGFSTLEQYAEYMNSPVQNVKFVNFQTPRISGINASEPILNAYAPVAEVDKVSEPLQGVLGVYVIKVTNRQEDNREFNPENMRRMTSSMNTYRFGQATNTLRKILDVQDNRSRFY